jgi:hypothetical protein
MLEAPGLNLGFAEGQRRRIRAATSATMRPARGRGNVHLNEPPADLSKMTLIDIEHVCKVSTDDIIERSY